MLKDINSPADLKKMSLEEMKGLADEIRTFLIETVSVTGGHLSPNLGVVELTLALHRVFDSPSDGIIWDVGHQCYVHKLLTGRAAGFCRLRMKDGLSGFPKPTESPHDIVHAGHSSTSLSIAAGIARAKRLSGIQSDTIAVIGDGAFTAGMVYEALNDITHNSLPVIIILNDNERSISKNVGGISTYFQKLRIDRSFLQFKKKFQEFMSLKIPFFGKWLLGALYTVKEFIKAPFVSKNFFEDMGITYYGPIDGHDLKNLVRTLETIRGIGKPILIHCVTIKGKGYKPSEDNPGKYHGISGLCILPEDSLPDRKVTYSYSQAFGRILSDIARKDDKIIAITAAMKSGTGLADFAREFPDRFCDVGIAEQHAVSFALGLSIQGYKPFTAIYSTFLQRAYDQVIHDLAISGADVTLCLDRAGLVPGDGETHQGVFDIAFLRLVPGMTILAPSGLTDFRLMLEWAALGGKGPVAIRYPKDDAYDIPGVDAASWPVLPVSGVKIKEGRDLTIVSSGTLLAEALKAVKMLENEKISAGIYHLRMLKPINNEVYDILSGIKGVVLILEEGAAAGGFSEGMAAELRGRGHKQIYVQALPDEFPGVDSRDGLLSRYCLTADKISNTIKGILKNNG